MRPGRLGGFWLALVLVLGCGLFPRNRSRPQRVAPKVAVRVPPGPRGPRVATVPIQARPVPEILGQGVLVGIKDGISEVLDDPAAAEDEVAWLGARINRDGEANAHTLVVVRRAAFGVHVPAAGERREIDDDVLDGRDLGAGFDVVALLGTERACLTTRGNPVVTAMDLGGHVLDVRWPLRDCGPGPWAPVGLIAAGIPATLRWEPPQCDETAELRDAWASAGNPETAHLGALRDGPTLVALIGDGVLWIAASGSWQPREFGLGGAAARAACPDPLPTDVPG